MKLTIVTGNTDKFEQLREYVPVGIQVDQRAIDLPEIQTNLLTEISADKCLQAFEVVSGPVLVDDSGIYFDAYHDFPGALTKFLYEGIGLDGMRRMYTGVENLTARFQCVLSYMDESLDAPAQFVGEVEGKLDFSYLGVEQENPKIPYDLIFVPDGMSKPAIFDMQVWKSEYNHRVRAVKYFGEWLGDR